MPSAQALQRLQAGNVRYCQQRAGNAPPPGDATPAGFPFALVVGCLEPEAAGEHLFAEKPGAIEVVRNAGPSLGSDALAAVEYAALVQNVGVVLVLAHKGCGVGDPAVGHVRALRWELRRTDSLLGLTRSGQVKIAAGVLDPDTGAIQFLPDEPDEVEDDSASTPVNTITYGS